MHETTSLLMLGSGSPCVDTANADTPLKAGAGYGASWLANTCKQMF